RNTFFFQAEDGIRDFHVTGVQTCALPIFIQVKEIKFRPGTDDGDYQVKLRSLVRFLEEGDKAKITLRFRGREMAHQQIGMEVLKIGRASCRESVWICCGSSCCDDTGRQ